MHIRLISCCQIVRQLVLVAPSVVPTLLHPTVQNLAFVRFYPILLFYPQHELGTRVKNTKIIRFTAELHLAIISYQYLDLKTPTELYIQ